MTLSSKLSLRLNTAAELALPSQPLWDFCCDHGYLGEWALRSKKFSSVHFVDPVDSIIAKLKARLEQRLGAELQGVFYHLCPGEKVQQAVEGTAVILGVGPHVIVRILEGLQHSGQLKAERLILGPQRSPEVLTSWLELNLVQKGLFGPWRLLEIPEGQRMRELYVLDRLKAASPEST